MITLISMKTLLRAQRLLAFFVITLLLSACGGVSLDPNASTNASSSSNNGSSSSGNQATSSSSSGTSSSSGQANFSAKKIVGYFANWGVYGRNYHIKNIETSGSAAILTHIVYAFGNVTEGRCVVGDAYADYDKAYTAEGSVDGVADSFEPGVLRGNFGQLRKLKKLHPNLKVLWSFGGWTWSGPGRRVCRKPPQMPVNLPTPVSI